MFDIIQKRCFFQLHRIASDCINWTSMQWFLDAALAMVGIISKCCSCQPYQYIRIESNAPSPGRSSGHAWLPETLLSLGAVINPS